MGSITVHSSHYGQPVGETGNPPEGRRLAAEKNGTTVSAADDQNPVTMAKVTGAELLRSLRAEADRIADRDAAVAKARADAAREREELRTDLRARTERAEHQADAYRDELDRLRVGSLDPGRLEDAEEFFTGLGEQADAEIEDRYLAYAGPDVPGESAEDKQARLTQAMNRAAEEVPAELVTPSPASQGGPDPATVFR